MQVSRILKRQRSVSVAFILTATAVTSLTKLFGLPKKDHVVYEALFSSTLIPINFK